MIFRYYSWLLTLLVCLSSDLVLAEVPDNISEQEIRALLVDFEIVEEVNTEEKNQLFYRLSRSEECNDDPDCPYEFLMLKFESLEKDKHGKTFYSPRAPEAFWSNITSSVIELRYDQTAKETSKNSDDPMYGDNAYWFADYWNAACSCHVSRNYDIGFEWQGYTLWVSYARGADMGAEVDSKIESALRALPNRFANTQSK